MNWIILAWLSVSLFAFVASLRVTAPYGRHTSDSWGRTINNRWGWFWMELPSPLILGLLFWLGTAAWNSYAFLFWGLWTLHYVNRTLIYPLRQRDTQKRMPLAIVFSAVFFNVMNAGINGYFLGFESDVYPPDWWQDPRFLLGFGLFWAGLAINWQSDTILLNLRKPGETHYVIPKGGLFRFISCPNLFGEMVEWTGFALMVSHLSAWSFAIWTVANLLPRALSHHRWYLSKFPDYPKTRRAVFPGVL